jgi:phenylacetate-CoA ligase
MHGLQGFYIEAESKFALSDHIRVVVGSTDSELNASHVAKRLAAAIRVSPEVVIVSPEEVLKKTLREDKRKPVLFFDLRCP